MAKPLGLRPFLAFSVLVFSQCGPAAQQKEQPTEPLPEESAVVAQPEATASPLQEEMAPEAMPLSAEQLQVQYDEIVKKYLNEKYRPIVKGQTFSDADKNALYALYQQMAPAQQVEQRVKPYQRKDRALEKRTPSPSQWSEWSTSSAYGIWVDGQQIDASTIQDYQPADFAYYLVSKLMPNAKNADKHEYQLDLMTHAYLEASNAGDPNEILVGILMDPRRPKKGAGA